MNCAKKKYRESERGPTQREMRIQKDEEKKHTLSKRRRSSKNTLKVRTKQDFSIVPNGPRLFWHKTNWKYFLFDCAFKKKLFIHCSLPFKLVQCVCVYVILFFSADVECLLFCINFSIWNAYLLYVHISVAVNASFAHWSTLH